MKAASGTAGIAVSRMDETIGTNLAQTANVWILIGPQPHLQMPQLKLLALVVSPSGKGTIGAMTSTITKPASGMAGTVVSHMTITFGTNFAQNVNA